MTQNGFGWAQAIAVLVVGGLILSGIKLVLGWVWRRYKFRLQFPLVIERREASNA